jgi:hypothetical protein
MKYRVVKNLYRYRLVSEDGEGSLKNVTSITTISIVWEKEFEEEITVDSLPSIRINTEGYLGSVSINYELQVLENDEWCFVGFLNEKFDD